VPSLRRPIRSFFVLPLIRVGSGPRIRLPCDFLSRTGFGPRGPFSIPLPLPDIPIRSAAWITISGYRLDAPWRRWRRSDSGWVKIPCWLPESRPGENWNLCRVMTAKAEGWPLYAGIICPHRRHRSSRVSTRRRVLPSPIPFSGWTIFASTQTLPKHLDYLLTLKDRFLEIDGYCNSPGPPLKSSDPLYILSERRAKFIYDRLVEKGFDTSRVIYKGKGNTNPRSAHPTTRDEMDKNMRVEIQVFRSKPEGR